MCGLDSLLICQGWAPAPACPAAACLACMHVMAELVMQAEPLSPLTIRSAAQLGRLDGLRAC